MCDVVINHRCASEQSESGVWNVFGDIGVAAGGVSEKNLHRSPDHDLLSG